MLRRVFSIVCVISLLLWMAVAWAWRLSWARTEALAVAYVGTDCERVLWLSGEENTAGVVLLVPRFPTGIIGRLRTLSPMHYGEHHPGFNLVHRSMSPHRMVGKPDPYGSALYFHADVLRTIQSYESRWIRGGRATDPPLIVPVREYRLYSPFWLPVLLLAILPSIKLLSIVRSRLRSRAGECASCGYNLTGNTSGVCPECGTPITSSAGVKA